MSASGQNLTCGECPLLAQSCRSQERPLLGEQRKTYAQLESSGFDPTATLAVHCGNGFDARFAPIKVLI
jgi:hypothetical protein